MVFSSLVFLLRFLPIALALYFLAPKRLKNTVLLFSSLLFYAWGEPRYIFIMFLSILTDFICGLGIELYRSSVVRKRLFLAVSLIVNLGLLIGFKYLDFIGESFSLLFDLAYTPLEISLPLGISFYTFQTMSYTLDVYKNKVKPETNLIDFGAYVSLFPQLIAGPIVKYVAISNSLKRHTVDLTQVDEGIRLFILGLASKVLLANTIGLLWTDAQKIGFTNLSTFMAWLAISAFAFQIYFDFSGYSLMAIGLGRILGFQFPSNFNFPYTASSVTDFWRRWHMSLGAWFREYVYIPLGGNRQGSLRRLLNILTVWALTGLWHGADWNFLLWGLYFAVILIVEKSIQTYVKSKLSFSAGSNLNVIAKCFLQVLQRFYVILIVWISWVLFALSDSQAIIALYRRLLSWHSGEDYVYALSGYGMVFFMCVVFSTPVLTHLEGYLKRRFKPVLDVLYVILFLITLTFLVDASFNPFLYFRF